MTYNAFADLDPLNEEYGSNSFNSSSNTNASTDTFDSNNPFADLDPLYGQPQAVTKPEVVEPIKPENDSPNSAVTDFILRDEDSFLGKVNRGAAERTATLAGGLVRFVGQTADEMADWMEERVPLGVVDISTDGISWRPSTKEDIAKPSFLLPAARTLEGADFGYKAGTTWEEVKAEPLANVLPWALEQGLISVPDMAASVIALPVYMTARTGEIGQARAENKGKKDATFQDFIEVLPAVVVTSLLERMGTSKIFGISTPVQSIADVPKEILKRGLVEGATEAVQEPLEYAAETIGTNVEFDPAVAAESALQGLISGQVTGSTISAATIPGEIALASRKPSDDGSGNESGTLSPEFADPNAVVITGDGTVVYREGTAPEDNSPALVSPSTNAGEWGVFPNVGGSYSVLNPATGENAGTFDSEQEAESVYQSKVVEASTQELEPTIPDAPTSEAPDIATVEVDINAQRAELDDDLAKIMADLDKPLGISVPPPFTPVPLEPPEEVTPQVQPESLESMTDGLPQLEADALTITADDMAQMDLDDVENQAEIDQEIAAFNASTAAIPTDLPPVASVKKKLLPLSQRPENTAQTKKVDPKLVDPTKDDLLTAVAKIGGVRRGEASAEGFDPADFGMRKAGLYPVFRAKPDQGVSFDAARETLAQDGYIDPNTTVNDFADLLQKAVRGETVVSNRNENYIAQQDAERLDDYTQQGGVIPEAPAPQASVSSADQTLTSAIDEARNGNLPQSEIDSILTNYPKESDAVLQLQMSMAGVEIGDSSGSNQAARVGDLRPERNVQQGEGDRGLAGSSTDVATGSSNNESQNVTDAMGVLLSPSATSGNTNADSEAGSGGGINNAGLLRAEDAGSSSLDGSMNTSERTRIEDKLSAMSTKDFAKVLKNSGLLKTGTKESKIKRLVDAREGAEAIARFDSFDDFVEAVNDSPKWQDTLTKTTISTTTLLKWANATKMKGDVFSRKDILRNADNLWGWATASGAITTPRSVEKSRYEGESRQDADQRALNNQIELSKKASESTSFFERSVDPSLTQEEIQTKYEAMVASEDKRLVQAEKDSKAESFDLETQTEESLAADTEQATTAAAEQAAKDRTASNRAKADADLSGFTLTGSDAPADIAVAQGQEDMFDADPNGTGQDQVREDEGTYIGDEDSTPEDGGQQSLFGGLFAPKGIPKKAKLEQIKDNFRIRYEQVEVGQIAVGIDTVTNPNEAAHVIASIRKHAQETLMAVVTNEQGKVLNVIRHSKGGTTAAGVYYVELAGAVAATKGAKKVWFAHNHPSGNYSPSNSDALAQQSLEDTLDGTGIEPQGHIIVAPGSKKLGFVKIVGVNRQKRLEGVITPLARNRTLKVTERLLRKRRMKDAPVVKTYKEVMAVANSIDSANAIILMSQNNVIGSITMSSSEMLSLRKDGQVTRILASMSETNANGVIIKTDNEAAAENVNRFLNRQQMKLIIHDWVVNGESALGTNNADKLKTKGPFFSKSVVLSPSANPKGVSEKQAKDRVKLFLEKYKGADDVKVIIRDTQAATFGLDSRKLNGGIAAGFFPDTNTVVLVLENLDSVQEIDAAIRHELLVHKGLGLFKKEDVNKLLKVIQENAAESSTLKKMWAEVQLKYKEETLEVQAEELLAKVAEKKMSKPDKYWNKIVTFIRDMLRKIGLVKEISFADLRKVVYDMGDAFKDGRRAERREGFADKTNETKSPSSDGLSGSKGFSMKKGGRADKKVKVDPGDGTADVTIYGVDSDGKRMLVAKNRKGGWDITVDRRVDGEMFTDGKPLKYTANNRKQVADRIESLGLTLEEVIIPFAEAQREVLNEADSFFMASSTLFERRRFDFQDRFLSALKVQKAIEDFTFKQISEDMDFYNRETLKHGITTAQITEFNDTFIDPLLTFMDKNDLSITDVGNFLYARHAPEANAEMKKRNAAFEDNESKSGMSDVEAAKIMADFKAAGKMDVLNGIAQTTDKVIERTRQILVDTGLLSEATVQSYRDQYDVYVPLLGDPMDPDGKEKMKKSKDESRFGRSSKADNVLINLIVQHEQTIIRGENNVLKRVMLKLVEQNPNPDFWVIDKTTDEKVLDPVTDLFVLKKTPNKRHGKHVVPVRVAGEEHLIVFEQSNDHAMMLAGSMNNVNAKELNMIVQAGLKFNRYISMINTQYNLEFMPTNLARDIQTALINVYQYEKVDSAMVARIAKNVRKSIKAIREYQKGNRDGEMAGWYDEFYKNGAQTGWLDNYESMSSRGRQLDMMMKRKGHMSLDAAYRMVELVSDLNTAFENGVRLATYIEFRKAGYSIQGASIPAKNLTVNFNRRGDKALLAGSLYVFFNASMQGNAAIIQAAQNKAVRKAMMAVFGMQVALEMMNRLMGDDDEDGQSVYSKIPLYIRNNNWVILLPDFGDKTDAAKRMYTKIPLSYGYNVINVAAQVTGAAASQLFGNRDADGLDAGVAFSRVWGALVHGFNPVGSDASALQAVSFTALDPLAQDASNENFAGQPIRPEQNPYGPPKPDSMLFWQSTPEYIKSISSTLNEVSGGTDIRPGDISASPETIEHYAKFFMGGAGNFFKATWETPALLLQGEQTEIRDYPWIRKFLGQVGDRTDVDNYYKAHTDIAYAQQAIDAAAKTEGSASQIKAAVKLVEKEEGFKLELIPRLDAADLFIASKKLEKADYEANTTLSAKRKKTLIDGVDRQIRNRRITFVSMYRRALDRQARFGG